MRPLFSSIHSHLHLTDAVIFLAAVVVRQASINAKPFAFALVSRRSRHRVGTRYFTRGVDSKGHASNSNETEQIVVVPRKGGEGEEVFSYVQTRGSVPVYWSQVNTLRYVPDLQVMDKPETVRLPWFVILSAQH